MDFRPKVIFDENQDFHVFAVSVDQNGSSVGNFFTPKMLSKTIIFHKKTKKDHTMCFSTQMTVLKISTKLGENWSFLAFLVWSKWFLVEKVVYECGVAENFSA